MDTAGKGRTAGMDTAEIVTAGIDTAGMGIVD
jgi:hypothetical protein